MSSQKNRKNRNNLAPLMGEVYLMKFSGNDNEQQGWRPGLVFQNNTGNIYSPNVIALPLTSVKKKVEQPTHVVIAAKEGGLIKDSMVLCENPERMSKHNIGRYLTSLNSKEMEMVATAYLLAVPAIAYLNVDTLISLRDEAILLNEPA